MRIGLFTNNYLPRVSGPANVVHNLYEGLSDLGHDVFVFAPKYTGATKSSRNIIRIPSLRLPSHIFYPIPLPSFSDAEKILEDLDLDIFHSHHPMMIGKLALYGAKRFNKPLVFTYHSEWGSYLKAMFPNSPIDSIDKLLKTFSRDYISSADAVIVPNKKLYKKINHRNIYLLPSAIRPFSRGETIDVFRYYDLRPGSKILLCVSRLSPEKNIDSLIKMVSPLLRKYKDLYLMLVGDGMSKLKLKYLADDLRVGNKVIFTGEIMHEDLPNYFKSATIFTYPSRFDTQGLSVVEAMHFGLPIVAFKTSFFEDVVGESKSGLLVGSKKDFGRAVEKILNNTKLADRMGKKAQSSSKRFEAKSIMEKTVFIYEELLNGQDL